MSEILAQTTFTSVVQKNEVCDEIVKGLNSYTERSISKKGLHIICYGTLPNGRRRSGNFKSQNQ